MTQPVTPVIKRTRVKTESYEVCPHCNEEIREKSTYMDPENFRYHRPCMAKGPIEQVKPCKIVWDKNGIRCADEPLSKAAQEEGGFNEFLSITVPLSDRENTMLFMAVVNQGIDSHLEGFVSSRFRSGPGQFREQRLIMEFHYSELPILTRRLRERGTEEAERWAEDIEETPEYAEAMSHPAERKQPDEASPLAVMPELPQVSDAELDAVLGEDDDAITGAAAGKVVTAQDESYVEVPPAFVGRPEVKSMRIALAGGKIHVLLSVDGVKQPISKVFDASDWRAGWHNGVKRMMNMAMSQDKAFDAWVLQTFGASRDNPTGITKMEVPEVTDAEIDAAVDQGDDVMATTRPTIVRLANGNFGLRIARKDLGKVMSMRPDGTAALSKAAVVALAVKTAQDDGRRQNGMRGPTEDEMAFRRDRSGSPAGDAVREHLGMPPAPGAQEDLSYETWEGRYGKKMTRPMSMDFVDKHGRPKDLDRSQAIRRTKGRKIADENQNAYIAWLLGRLDAGAKPDDDYGVQGAVFQLIAGSDKASAARLLAWLRKEIETSPTKQNIQNAARLAMFVEGQAQAEAILAAHGYVKDPVSGKWSPNDAGKAMGA